MCANCLTSENRKIFQLFFKVAIFIENHLEGQYYVLISQWNQHCASRDFYNGKRMMLSGQTIPDLVARYGTMNWFYELNPDEIYSIENPALVNLSPDAIVQNIEAAFQANGVSSDVAYEGGKLEIALWQDGLAESIAGLKDFGIDETYDGWVEFKNGMMTTYDAARDAVDISGGKEIPIVLNVVDENDHNKVFLTIESREVTFDIMAE